MTKLVKVELGPEGNVIRIFRKDKRWLDVPEDRVKTMTKAEAVGEIRMQVYLRSHRLARGLMGYIDTHVCERCGRSINWTTMEMHETIPKGKGGEVSLKNCEALCRACHQGRPDSAHGNRRWQTARIKGS